MEHAKQSSPDGKFGNDRKEDHVGERGDREQQPRQLSGLEEFPEHSESGSAEPDALRRNEQGQSEEEVRRMVKNDHWIDQAVTTAKEEGCRKGFFGEVSIRLKIQDGTIQTALVEKSIRLRSDRDAKETSRAPSTSIEKSK